MVVDIFHLLLKAPVIQNPSGHGRPRPKVCFPAALVMGMIFVGPRASERKGQEYPQAIQNFNCTKPLFNAPVPLT